MMEHGTEHGTGDEPGRLGSEEKKTFRRWLIVSAGFQLMAILALIAGLSLFQEHDAGAKGSGATVHAEAH